MKDGQGMAGEVVGDGGMEGWSTGWVEVCAWPGLGRGQEQGSRLHWCRLPSPRCWLAIQQGSF